MAYGRRYLTALAFNLATGDDDDGNAAGGDPVLLISDNQVADLEALIEEVGTTVAQFLQAKPYASLDQIPAARYSAAIHMLERKRDLA